MSPSPAQVDIGALEADMVASHGEAQRARIHRGLMQVAALWRPEDGDLAAFAREHFIADPAVLAATRDRLEWVFEQLDGHELEIGRALRWPAEVDVGPVLPVDPLLGAFDPAAHLNEDLFDSKIAFVVLLNWPLTTLAERNANASTWTRAQWAEARLAGRFQRRVPAGVMQEISRVASEADLYIAQYNIWAHHVLGPGGERLFPKGKRLITHWNLRDEIKAGYAAGPEGLARQRAIAKVMERIVTQTIPHSVIDNPRVDWNPFTNTVVAAPADEVEPDAPARTAGVKVDATFEPDTRYAMLLAQFHAHQKADPYSPSAPTLIARVFEQERELPLERVEAMLTQLLTSPEAAKVAKEMERRLGRKLEPYDIWFDGFKARSKISEAQLDELTRKRYPTADAFARDIPRILTELGFAPDRAQYVAERIRVDPSRGAGHAMPAARRGDFPHLRTRVEKGGMDYKGYNIAVHELGHNVEQVFSLYDVDHTLLAGVPNNAFTEALAFVFQRRDLELLGLSKPDPAAERENVLADFMQAWELAGVSLVDLRVWQWMYAHPDATPAALKEATLQIARDVWNRYYAPLLGTTDSPLLAVYSHMIAYPLYLADYPIGLMITAQVEEHFKTCTRPLGAEFEQMASFGSVTPDAWMIHATGAPVGPEALLRATEAALSSS
ncbi:MAG: hypothetical protein IRZ16_16455 [Myxococcaceae bacterium]|nr:hypothetical protein [Myxococcaceae bacterium]